MQQPYKTRVEFADILRRTL